MRILIAEDEESIAEALRVLLEKNNFTADVVYNGPDALDHLLLAEYDAVVLDIMMPGLDGIEVLRRARDSGVTVPVLFLTAKSDISDRVAGLDAGADDYLPKPFATAEFLARVRALTRRRGSYASDTVTLGGTTLDCGSYELICGERSERLGNKEFRIMELFMRNPDRVFSTEYLFDTMWDSSVETEINVVWTYISYLRRKLRQLDSRLELRTVRGAGYILEERSC